MIDNQEHFHLSDRFPTRDTLLWLHSLEKIVDVGANDIIGNDEDYVLVDTTLGNITITLPHAINGRKIIISNFKGSNIVFLTSTVKINNSDLDFTIAPGITTTVKNIYGEWLAW